MKSNVLKSVFTLTIMLLATVTVISSCSKESDTRDNFVGSYRTNWEFVYNGQKFQGTYTLTIVKSSTNKTDVILNNINDTNESVRASINGNSMVIPQQALLDYGISGSGTLTGNVLNFSTLETETGGVQVNATQVATKQ